MMKHIMLYIPGLGDQYDTYRKRALGLWRFFGVEARLLPMNWYDGASYADKYGEASRAISSLLEAGMKVSLVGESAGGSMAINLFARHPEVTSLITIAGVNTPTTPVAARTLRRGPAFAISRQHIGESLASLSIQRRRSIYTVSGLRDDVVRRRDSRITGAHNHHIWTIGHLLTITACLTVFSGYIISMAKKPNSV
jgi:pimeloyl-ACP methyl ester carboxylesterase